MDILRYYRRKTLLNKVGSIGVNGRIQFRKRLFSFVSNRILSGTRMSTLPLSGGNKSDILHIRRSDAESNRPHPASSQAPPTLAPPHRKQADLNCDRKHIKNNVSDGEEQKADGHKTQLGMQNRCSIFQSFWCNIFSFVRKLSVFGPGGGSRHVWHQLLRWSGWEAVPTWQHSCAA